MMKKCAKWLLAIGAVLLLAFFLGRSDWPKYRRLQVEGVALDGWVTEKNIVDQNTVSYSFMVGERVYSGLGRGGYGNGSFNDLSVGDRVVVFYLPKDPRISCMGGPKEHLREQNRAISLGLLIFVPILAWALGRELRKAA